MIDREEYYKNIEKITAGMKCPHDFKCCKLEAGIENMCKVKYDHSEAYLECLEEDAGKNCKFAKLQRNKVFCQCPTRIKIFKSLKK